MPHKLAPPWQTQQRRLAAKLGYKMLRKKRGKAPVPETKAAQRKLAESLSALPPTVRA